MQRFRAFLLPRTATWLLLLLSLAAIGQVSTSAAEPEAAEKLAHPPRTFFVTRSLTHEQLLPYLKAARPEIVQIGNYGPMFHGYADNEKSTGWPMQLPVAGERAALDYQRKLNDQVHELGLSVVGHFRLVKVMGNWKEQTGFVDYYNNRWPTELLGEKPHPQVVELLQRDAAGEPLQLGRYNQSQLALCLSSPFARQMLKQMLKTAVDQHIDGVMTNFNYHFGCACPHCQRGFKRWLAEHLTPAELQAKLNIKNLQEHKFAEIPAHLAGYPKPEEAQEINWLASRWGAEHFKRMFDEVFLDYGRTLKKDLLVAQWNHLSHVSVGEERAFTPLELWGRGEDYFWYSGGAAFVGKNLSLKQGKAGDAWLSCLYVREMSGGKPFVIGKYDRIRMAASMAEGYATGGLGMGRYMKFEEPIGFEVLARYTRFMHDHRHLFDDAAPFADAALVLPRQSILNRHPESLDEFRDLGQALLQRQVQLDVLLDQRISKGRLSQYPAVILPKVLALSDDQRQALQDYAACGGLLLVRGEAAMLDEQGQPRVAPGIEGGVAITAEIPGAAADEIAAKLQERGGSVIESPWTVRATAYAQPNRVVLHLVNYDREEDAPEANQTGPETERPQPVENITITQRLPEGTMARQVVLHRPDAPPIELKLGQQERHVKFRVPQLKVYGVIAIEIESK